jgi:hypothetical protein
MSMMSCPKKVPEKTTPSIYHFEYVETTCKAIEQPEQTEKGRPIAGGPDMLYFSVSC